MTIRVVVVDDQQLFREMLQSWLQLRPDLTIVGTAGDGATALQVVAATLPDVVVMDIQMPGLDGIATTAELRRRHPQCQVVLLTTFDELPQIQAGLAAGAISYVTKNDVAMVLHQAILAAAQGSAWLPSSVATPLIQALHQAVPASAAVALPQRPCP